MQGIEDGELYARWVQFGVFSPILRLHSTNNPYQDRRPWAQDAATFQVMRDALQLRHQLIPYLYTMAWRNHAEGHAADHADVLRASRRRERLSLSAAISLRHAN